MSSDYSFSIVEVRRCIYESCKELFNNSDIAETVYREIMNPLEDFLSEKESEESRRCENCKWYGLVEGLNWLACTKHIHVHYHCDSDVCALWESKDTDLQPTVIEAEEQEHGCGKSEEEKE